MGFITEELLKGRTAPDWEADAFQLTLYTLALGLQAKLVYEIGVGLPFSCGVAVIHKTMEGWF